MQNRPCDATLADRIPLLHHLLKTDLKMEQETIDAGYIVDRVKSQLQKL